MSNPPIWAHQHLTSAQTLASPRNIPQPTQHTTNHHRTKPPTIHMGTSLQTPNFLFIPPIHNPPTQMTSAIILTWNLTPHHNDQALRTWKHVYTKAVQQTMQILR